MCVGPPPSPTNLVARVKSDSPNMLDISWSTPPFIPGAPVNFRITITKLDTSEDFRIALTNQGTFENFRVTLTNFMTSETTSEVVAEEHYVFDAGSGRRAPDTYLIEVEAVNPAGSSLPAELLAILPNTRRGISPAQVYLLINKHTVQGFILRGIRCGSSSPLPPPPPPRLAIQSNLSYLSTLGLGVPV